MSVPKQSEPSLGYVFLVFYFGRMPWAVLIALCAASALVPILFTPLQSVANQMATAVMGTSAFPRSLLLIMIYTPTFAVYASTNLATFVFGSRLRTLFRSSFYRIDLQQTPLTRAQLFDSLASIAVPSSIAIAVGEIIASTISQIVRLGGVFASGFRLELALYPRLYRIEAMAGVQFDFLQILFAGITLNVVRVFEIALLLLAGTFAFVSTLRIEAAFLRTCMAVLFIAGLNAAITILHTETLLPFDVSIARKGFVVDTQVFIDFAFTLSLLNFLTSAMRTRFISAPLAIEQDP